MTNWQSLLLVLVQMMAVCVRISNCSFLLLRLAALDALLWTDTSLGLVSAYSFTILKYAEVSKYGCVVGAVLLECTRRT